LAQDVRSFSIILENSLTFPYHHLFLVFLQGFTSLESYASPLLMNISVLLLLLSTSIQKNWGSIL